MTAVAFPIPEKGIKKPSIEIEGIVYRKLITPKVGFAVFRNSLIKIPTMPPNKTAITMASKEISKCSHNKFKKKSFLSIKIAHIFCNIAYFPLLMIALTGHSSAHNPQCRQCF